MTVAFHSSTGSDDETIRFAAAELANHLQRMGNRETPRADAAMVFRLGTLSELGVADAADDALDDRILIEVGPNGGVLAGSNPRSVLFAVYGYLHDCGCRFLGPQPWLEHIPSEIPPRPVNREERPSFRYRALTIEGGIGADDLHRLVDWLPKAGFNAYHLQLDSNHAFLNRWYRTALGGACERSLKQCRQITAQVTRELTRRGLQVWSMGHGWASEAMGIPALSWEPVQLTEQIDSPVKLAEVNGERQWWRQIPIDTNACYSDPDTRRTIVTHAADYAQDHPSTDVVFFWMADDVNNHCECAVCRLQRPADWYVDMLNDLDRELGQRGIGTRIGFLVFCESLWPPLRAKLANPDRFLLTFAPMGVTSAEGLSGIAGDVVLPEFALNNIAGEDSPDVSFAFLDAWRKDQYDNDVVVLIYDLLSTGLDKDLTGMSSGSAINHTLRTHHRLGIAGVSSCQAQRAFFPTPWPMHALAETLWNVHADLDALRRDMFETLFAEYGAEVAQILDELTRQLDPEFVQGRIARDTDACSEVADHCRDGAERLHRVADQSTRPGTAGEVATVLQAYAAFIPRVCDLYTARAGGAGRMRLRQMWRDALGQLQAMPEVAAVCDVEWFERTFRLLSIEEQAFVSNYAS